MVEIWKEVVGYPLYEVSTKGRVRSYNTNRKDIERLETPRILKAGVNTGGYLQVMLYDSEGGKKNFSVHTLVITTFLGPPPQGMQCCHNDSNKQNNNLSNLRWDTPKGNSADKVALGRSTTGERNPKAVVNENTVLLIRRRVDAGEKISKVASDLDLNWQITYRIAKRKFWTNI